jgi:hypothetical protein
VGKKNPDGNLENITVRLDTKIMEAAEISAKDRRVPLSVEIRSALTSYYKLGTSTVTFEALEERLRKHEELFHGAKETLWPDQYRVPVQDSGVLAEVNKIEEVAPKIEPESDKATLSTEKTVDNIKILARLIEMLETGLNPTSADLEEATGIPSRKIGRLLNAQGIVAKNTRIANKSARYFLPAMLPKVKEVYEKLKR